LYRKGIIISKVGKSTICKNTNLSYWLYYFLQKITGKVLIVEEVPCNEKKIPYTAIRIVAPL